MKHFILKIFKLYFLILLFTYPFKFMILKQEQDLIKNGTDKNFIKWSEFENSESVNTIFLGSSKIYCSVKSSKFDSITGLRSYNLGTGSQSIIESFYYLKHAKKNKNIKNVILDLHLSSFQHVDLMHIRRNMQYLNKDIKKELYIHSGLAKNIWCELIPMLEYSKYLQKIPESILYFLNKKSNNPISGKTVNQNTWERGFQNSNQNDTMSKIDFETNYLETINFENPRKQYPHMCFLDSIMNFCEINKIKLILTNIPSGSWTTDTKNCTKVFREYFKNNNKINFFYKFPQLKNIDVRSDGFHINNSGANKITHSIGYCCVFTASKSNHTHQGSN
jgi:hypothetical protein